MNREISSLHLQKPHLISVKPTTSIGQTLEILKKHNIISIPIQSHDKDHGFIGIISAFDICCYILRKNNFDHHIESALSLNSDSESFVLIEVAAFDTLRTVMNHLSTVHRLLVVDKKRQFLISQSDIIRYFYEHPIKEEECRKTLEQVFPVRDIMSITTTLSAKEGFEKLKTSNHLALPIVDENNKFVHVLSSADLRGIDQQTFKLLDLKILDYLTSIKKQKPKTATLQTTVQDVMKLSVANLAHRTFVLSAQGEIINVISLTDLIKLFLKE
eukprot:NODE_84_length_22349_cov_0.357888.p11 type:complete len:272 gc:universal NODE_84_length_22349_cov_0.357888:9113-9928(+)